MYRKHEQIIPGRMAQTACLGLRRELRHCQGDNDAGCDDEYIDLLRAVCGCDAVQGIYYAENLGPAVLQCFSHFDQNAEKAADFCFSHEISPFRLCLLPLL